MSDLTAFLLARIAEDEAGARALDWMPRWVMAADLPAVADGIVQHIARHDPARVLRECEAKRRIVEAAEGWRWDRDDRGPDPKSDEVLRILATAYSDRPDYREEWKA